MEKGSRCQIGETDSTDLMYGYVYLLHVPVLCHALRSSHPPRSCSRKARAGRHAALSGVHGTIQYRTTEYHPPTPLRACSARRAQIQRRSDCHPPTLHGQIGHLISFEPHPLGKAYNPARRCVPLFVVLGPLLDKS